MKYTVWGVQSIPISLRGDITRFAVKTILKCIEILNRVTRTNILHFSYTSKTKQRNKFKEKEIKFVVNRGVGETDEGSQKVQTSSYMINKS